MSKKRIDRLHLDDERIFIERYVNITDGNQDILNDIEEMKHSPFPNRGYIILIPKTLYYV